MGSENREIYWIALSMVPGVGCKTAHQLLEVVEEPENLFMETRKGLEAIFGKRTNIIDAILSKSMFAEAEKEIKYAAINNVNILVMLRIIIFNILSIISPLLVLADFFVQFKKEL